MTVSELREYLAVLTDFGFNAVALGCIIKLVFFNKLN